MCRAAHNGRRTPAKEAFGIDGEKGSSHTLETAKLAKAWKQEPVHAETRSQVDAVA